MAYENDNYDDVEPRSPISMVRNTAWGLAKFSATYDTLRMLKQGPGRGYYVPWTRGGAIGGFGTQQGWWGRGGLRFGMKPVRQAGLRQIFERAPIWGFGAARKTAVMTFGEKAAASAFTKYAVSRAAGIVLGPVLGVVLAADILSAGAGIYRTVSTAVTRGKYLELGGYFPETQGAYTSRQRALQAITASQLQARSAIGNEAMLFHRS